MRVVLYYFAENTHDRVYLRREYRSKMPIIIPYGK